MRQLLITVELPNLRLGPISKVGLPHFSDDSHPDKLKFDLGMPQPDVSNIRHMSL